MYAVCPEDSLDKTRSRVRRASTTSGCRSKWSPLTSGGGEETLASVEAYFAERSYAGEMWERCGKRGYWVYGEEEARGYVRRKDRPLNLSFLEQIQLIVSSSSSSPDDGEL
ncbi:unnamed protein product [Linum tenue]|uniref:Uncharacterized protein n=1 Tax=Linum tenue TaxID=586396 RepID=A0AAV0HWV5_9ROSI|nr:unnamed protein product [Linum tenue]